MTDPIISFKDVHLSFGEKVVLDGLTFDVYSKDIISIAGPSGSGKSTILKLISGILKPDSGVIKIKAERLGMAFQHSALFNSITVWENLALPLQETTKVSSEEIDKRIKECLELVGLAHTEDLYPSELSGGMQKRVSIARALAIRPDIILFDEPSTGLDPATASKLEDDIVYLRDQLEFTSVVVTHDVETLKRVSDRILILDKGKVAWLGTEKQFIDNNTPYTCSLKERMTPEACENKYGYD